eukprot:COSAG05_NODE_17361_length_326_cov_1.132159_2_plen_70_part_01
MSRGEGLAISNRSTFGVGVGFSRNFSSSNLDANCSDRFVGGTGLGVGVDLGLGFALRGFFPVGSVPSPTT